jgi:hypothetical protein
MCNDKCGVKMRVTAVELRIDSSYTCKYDDRKAAFTCMKFNKGKAYLEENYCRKTAMTGEIQNLVDNTVIPSSQ